MGDLEVSFVRSQRELYDLVPLVSRLYFEIHNQVTSREDGVTILQELMDVGTIAVAREGHISVGMLDGRVVPKANAYSLGWLYVLRSRRGQGVGHCLLQAQIDYAREQHYAFAGASIAKTNMASKKLFEECGFVVYRMVGNQYVMRLDL